MLPVIIPEIVAAGISGLSSLLGGFQANKSQKDTNRINLQIARENNAQQLAIARENNAAQYAAMMANNQWSKDTAIEMFNLENAYNTPSAQRRRLLEAGLNPAVIMNGSGSSVPANASAPSAAGSTISPQIPSFVTPTLGAPPPVMLGAIDAISKLASAGAQAAAAAKTRKEASWIDESMRNQIDEIKARITNEEAQAAYQKMITDIEKANLPNKYKAEITKLSTSAALDILNGRVAEADVRLKDAETLLSKLNYKSQNAQLPLILSNLKQTFNVLQAQAADANASAAEHLAGRDLKKAQEALANANVETQEIINDYLPEHEILKLSDEEIGIVDRIMTAGRAKSVAELADELINAGLRKDMSEMIGDAIRKMRQRKRYQKR